MILLQATAAGASAFHLYTGLIRVRFGQLKSSKRGNETSSIHGLRIVRSPYAN
jgi:hypothetical protein